MVLFLVDSFDIVREMRRRFVLDFFMEKASSTTALVKLNTLVLNIKKIRWMLALQLDLK